MSFSNSNFSNILSRTKGKISSFISDVLYTQPDSYLRLNSALKKFPNLNKSSPIDLYRSDYIPSNKNINSSILNFENRDYSDFLGQKTSRTNTNNIQKKINIPNDRRYHKSLLESSLDKIRNEIRQKREENIVRMNELSNKSDKLNDYFYNENNNNKGKFTSLFNSKSINKIENEDNINLDENELNVYNSSSKKDYINSFNENSFVEKNNLKRTFDTDLIQSDINESFSINPKNKRKKLDAQMISIQKQTEFSFNTNNKKEDNNNKNDKVLFGVPKESIKSPPLCDKAIFGVTPIINKEEKKENNDIKEINKEDKVIFGVPKEPIVSEPLSDIVSFGVKKEQKQEKTDKDNNILFGVPKESIKTEPLLDIPKFGFVKKEESKDEKVLDVPKDSNVIKQKTPFSTSNTFGVQKEEENKKEQKKSLFFSDNPFLMKIENTNDTDNDKKETPGLFGNVKSQNSLFGNNMEENNKNIFLNNNNDKESKVVKINAVDTSNSLFNTKEPDKKAIIFGDIGIFGKTNNDEKNKDNKTSSLFGDSKLINSTQGSLFGNKIEKNNDENGKTNSLFSNPTKNKEDNNFSLFGSKNNNPSLFNNMKESDNNNKSLFGNNIESKSSSLFGSTNPENSTSLFGNKIKDNKDNNFSLFGNENKTPLFGNSLNDNKNSLFGNSSNDNKTSLFGNTNITFHFGKNE